MKKYVFCLLVAASIALTGCVSAPQLAVPLSTTALSAPMKKVGVAMVMLPKIDTEFPGAGCLLCMATASMANSTLTTYTQTLPYEDLPKLKEQVAEVLRKKGAHPVVIAADLDLASLPDYSIKGPNVALKDFTSLKAKYNIDKILAINLQSVGITRAYANYFPAGAPVAQIRGNAAIINLNDNTYEWYVPLHVVKGSADNNWDEPPKFPGLTNAYFQVLEITKDSIINPLSN